MFSAHFLLLEALKDSKIPYLFLTDLVSVEFHRSQKKCLAILFLVIKKMSQLNYHWKIIFLYLTILTVKKFVSFNSVYEWLVGCF